MNATRRRRGWRPRLEVLEGRLVPANFTVNSTGDTSAGSGTAGDLRFCITQADANPGSTIGFDATVFTTAQTITLNGTALPDLTANTQITGPAAGVTVNAAGKSRVFVIDTSVAVVIANLTITGGSFSGQGGGILSSGVLTLSNCTLTGNSASGNDGSGRGGGIFNGAGALTLTDCVLNGNSSADGGGIANGGGPLTLTNCTLSGNTAFIDGGGLFDTAPATLTGCTFSNNVAVAGGGMDGGPLTLINCTLFGNTAQGNSVQGGGQGGGIRAEGALTLTNCTVSGNSASVGAGGIFGDLTLNNSIVAGNAAPASPELDGTVQAQYSLIQNPAGVSFAANSGHTITGKDPLLSPLGNYGGPTQTMPPMFGSPVIDAGNNALALDANGQPLTTDQRGLPRIVNGTVDMGAVEVQAGTTTPAGLNANQRFVFHLYQDLLGRQPSPAEVNFFGATLDQGFLTREQLATFFLNSFEYHERQVNDLYLRLLGRPADPASLTLGAASLSAGGSLDQLEAGILGSDEYFRLHGGTNAGFLQGLGQDVFGGSIDPADLSLFEAELATGTPRFLVAQQALATPQAAAVEAQRLYQQLLKRSASPAELAYPASLLLGGNDTAVLLGLLLSPEYANRP
jgi:hypothetical protein